MSRAVGYAVTAGLRVPWLRAAVVLALMAAFARAGRNQSQLARDLGVTGSTVRKWLRTDPELRAAMYGEWEQ